MNIVYKHIIRFVVFALLQALVFNQLNIGFGIHLMIQPLFIMLLPFELTVIPLMGIAFSMGLVIDIFSNTYGLNTSALVLMAYLRPIVFKFYGPREGYDPLKEPTSQDMGSSWFALVYGLLLGLHTLWFFSSRQLIHKFGLPFRIYFTKNSTQRRAFLPPCPTHPEFHFEQ